MVWKNGELLEVDRHLELREVTVLKQLQKLQLITLYLQAFLAKGNPLKQVCFRLSTQMLFGVGLELW
jgi:hypothetical protein